LLYNSYMSTKTPSKYLSRAKLKDLLTDNCIGAQGQEYNEAEAQDLLIEKTAESAEFEAAELLKQMALDAA